MDNDKLKPQPSQSKNDYVFAVIVGLVVGGILGGIGGIFLPGIYYSLVNPDVLKDGQFGLLYLKFADGRSDWSGHWHCFSLYCDGENASVG